MLILKLWSKIHVSLVIAKKIVSFTIKCKTQLNFVFLNYL